MTKKGITIDEAIKILTINNEHNPDYTDADREAAHQLGIEALKRIKDYRERSSLFATPLLSGETND